MVAHARTFCAVLLCGTQLLSIRATCGSIQKVGGRDLSFEGNAYETDRYQLGLYSREGTVHPYYHGKLSQIAVWDIALDASEIHEDL